MRFCMSSGVDAEPALEELFLRLPGVAYVHDAVSPRLVQLSQGWPRLHFSLRASAVCFGRGAWERGSEGEWVGMPTFDVYRLRTTEARDSVCAPLGTGGRAASGLRWRSLSRAGWAALWAVELVEWIVMVVVVVVMVEAVTVVADHEAAAELRARLTPDGRERC